MGLPVYIDPAEPVLLQVLLLQRLRSPARLGPDTPEPHTCERAGALDEGLLPGVLLAARGQRRAEATITCHPTPAPSGRASTAYRGPGLASTPEVRGAQARWAPGCCPACSL